MSIQLAYQINIDDLAAFSQHHARTSKRWRQRKHFTQALGIFSALLVALVWPEWTGVERVGFFIVLSLVWLFAYPFYYRWAVKRNARKMYSESASKDLLGEHTMVIDAEGVSETSAVGESKIAWSGVERIEDDGNSVYFYIGPVQAYVIPKRAFRTREDEQAFVQLAQAYRSARVEAPA